MVFKRKLFRRTEYFFQEIMRGEIVFQALLVGLVSGVLVVLFKISISGLFEFIVDNLHKLSFDRQIFLFPLITTLGGLISGLLVFKFAPETKGSGIPYVKMTLARMGSLTRVRSIIVKFLAGIAGIGTGLSLGREGPSVQLGAGAGALVGKLFKMKGANQEKLIAAGAGSAIGATFNAPIAGTIFVLEELLNRFSPSVLFPVLVATVSAAAVARYFLGNNPSFIIPASLSDITLENIPVCIILGVVAGVLGVVFAKVIFLNNKFFAALKNIPDWAKPAIAGLVTGIAGLFIPYILGSGNLSVDALLAHKFALASICIIFIGKFLITPFCFGSGAAGGIFLPMLMLGAFLGYLTGVGCNYAGFSVDPVTVALIGMGAFLSAVARTPITAAVMVFEMTGGYNYILPIMLSAAIADLMAESLGHKPIYSMLIVNSDKSGGAKILSELKAKECMSRNVEVVLKDDTIDDTMQKFNNSNHDAFPVIDSKRHLCGIVTRDDIEDAFFQSVSGDTRILYIMNPSPVTILEDENLYKAYYRLHSNSTDCLVVTNSHNTVKGIITRVDIHKALESS